MIDEDAEVALDWFLECGSGTYLGWSITAHDDDIVDVRGPEGGRVVAAALRRGLAARHVDRACVDVPVGLSLSEAVALAADVATSTDYGLAGGPWAEERSWLRVRAACLDGRGTGSGWMNAYDRGDVRGSRCNSWWTRFDNELDGEGLTQHWVICRGSGTGPGSGEFVEALHEYDENMDDALHDFVVPFEG